MQLFTLMHRDREVLDFEVDPVAGTACVTGVLDGACWAPGGAPLDDAHAYRLLSSLLSHRTIMSSRPDMPNILRATGARNHLDLALRGGGFSLSDHFWYREKGSSLTWDTCNYYDNGWDQSFGEAVLAHDYEALSKASLMTPDVTCGGSSVKAWLQTDSGARLLKATASGDDSDLLMEALVTRLLSRMLKAGEFVPYDIVTREGTTYSSCPTVADETYELIRADTLAEGLGYPAPSPKNLGNDSLRMFADLLSGLGIGNPSEVIAKVAVSSALTLDRDLGPANQAVMRNVQTGAYLPAPLLDYGRAFYIKQIPFEKWAKMDPSFLLLIVTAYFNDLDPSWDYSWFDPSSLDGFDQEVRYTIEESGVFPDGFAEVASGLFKAQLAYVTKVAQAS